MVSTSSSYGLLSIPLELVSLELEARVWCVERQRQPATLVLSCETDKLVGDKLGFRFSVSKYTLPKTNIAPENRPGPKRKVVFLLPTINFHGLLVCVVDIAAKSVALSVGHF